MTASLRDAGWKIFNVAPPMRTDDFDFELPPELVAQVPAEKRDSSRLLVLDRKSEQVTHHTFPHLLELLHPGDVLVLNDSKVIPARLRGLNEKTNGRFELLLVEENEPNDWWVMLRPGKRARIGTHIRLLNHGDGQSEWTGEVVTTNDEGHRRIRFIGGDNILNALDQMGELPLPPYIERPPGKSSDQDLVRYQTVFAKPPGSVAAPTAGLHFTPEFLDAARAGGIRVEFVTLHVGLGTFAPVKADHISEHVMHEERFQICEATASAVNEAKQNGHRVVAVGTTSMRVLESVGRAHGGKLVAGSGRTSIFIHPPQCFSLVDALLTNFHLPRSTLLMLVSAFAAPSELRGRELVLRAYAEAIRQRYRFFSYGDAMFIA